MCCLFLDWVALYNGIQFNFTEVRKTEGWKWPQMHSSNFIILIKVSLTLHTMGVKCHQNLWKLIKSCVLRVIISFHSFSALTINQTFVKRKERENPKYSTPRFEYFHSLKQIEGFPFRLSNTFPDIFTAPLTVQ